MAQQRSEREKLGLGALVIGFLALLVQYRKKVASVGARVSTFVFDTAKEGLFATSASAATAGRAAPYVTSIWRVAQEQNVNPFVVVALGERESAWGHTLTPKGPEGTGDGGHGRGLLQIDDRAFPAFTGGEGWKDPYSNISFGAALLKKNEQYFQGKGLKGDALLAATIASYNTGTLNVWRSIQAGKSPDATTTGGDYSAWVLSKYSKYWQSWVASGGTRAA